MITRYKDFVFESLSKGVMPDDLVEWCYRLYNEMQPDDAYPVHKIPQHIIQETKKMVTDISGGKIWRGFGLWDKISDADLNEDKTRTFKYDWGASWTYNKDVAIKFAKGKAEDEDQYGYLAEYNINKLSAPISMDLIMKNKDYRLYEPEYEIIVIEEFKVPIDNIVLIASL